MDSLVAFLQPFFAWLLRTTLQASLLICLILLVQKALGRQLGVRGRYCLWLVLLVRMALPWAPQSPLSVHNLLPWQPLTGYELTAVAQSRDVGLAPAAPDGVTPMREYARIADGARRTGAAMGLGAQVRHWSQGRILVLLLLIWLTGACLLTGSIVAAHIRLGRIVRRERPVTDKRILDLLEDCRRQMRTARVVGVIATDRIDSPALFGCLRPRLLLPRATMAELSLPELRHVFLHELAHLRRDDIVISYLVTLLHVLHWFNPLIRLAFKRMRADREQVCDGLALSLLPPDETAAYGLTIVHQIEQSLTLRPRWMLAALSGDRARIRERIIMIARFRRETFRRSPLAFALVVLLACTGLTDGLTADRPAVFYEPAKDVPATHQDRHANIERIIIRHRDTGKCLVVNGETVTCDANAPGDAGLWEARFDENLGTRDQIVYLYSVATCRYLTWDEEGNLAVNGREPNETARWCVWAHTSGGRISPYPFAHLYLRPVGQGRVKAGYGTGPSIGWDIDVLWRVKTSDYPKDVAAWHREHVPGPDWGPPWSTQGRRK